MSGRRDINEYLDGRLTPARREAFEAAARADAKLAAELAETRRVRDLLAALPVEQAPADLVGGIMAQVAAAPVPFRRPALLVVLTELGRPRRLAAVGAAAAVLLTVGSLLRPEPLPSPVGHRQSTRLSDADAAFLDAAEHEYYSLMAARPVGSTPSTETINDAARGL